MHCAPVHRENSNVPHHLRRRPLPGAGSGSYCPQQRVRQETTLQVSTILRTSSGVYGELRAPGGATVNIEQFIRDSAAGSSTRSSEPWGPSSGPRTARRSATAWPTKRRAAGLRRRRHSKTRPTRLAAPAGAWKFSVARQRHPEGMNEASGRRLPRSG